MTIFHLLFTLYKTRVGKEYHLHPFQNLLIMNKAIKENHYMILSKVIGPILLHLTSTVQ